MKAKNVIFIFFLSFYNIAVNAAHESIFEAIDENSKNAQQVINYGTHAVNIADLTNANLETPRPQRLREIFSQADETTVANLLWYRWFFRKIANFSEAIGNTFFYCGSGLSSIAAAATSIYPPATDYFLFASVACTTANLLLFVLAKYCAREVSEREIILNKLAKKVKFHVISLTPVITNDRESTRDPHKI
jgi:hypothetical protein